VKARADARVTQGGEHAAEQILHVGQHLGAVVRDVGHDVLTAAAAALK
jgi:hypothetical protein